jgi:hypothetical protein
MSSNSLATTDSSFAAAAVVAETATGNDDNSTPPSPVPDGLTTDFNTITTITDSEELMLDDTPYNLPPGRMHATRVPERLSGAGYLHSSLVSSSPLQQQQQLKGIVGGSGSGSVTKNPRSRSRSPAATKITTSSTYYDGNSSISSLDNLELLVDPDILYDRHGLDDLPQQQQRNHHHSGNNNYLPAVNERLSEETLEDVHAFSDFSISNSRGCASVRSGLEPLNEGDNEDDDLDQINEEDEEEFGMVILTNLDDLQLSSGGGGGGQAGSSLAVESATANSTGAVGGDSICD